MVIVVEAIERHTLHKKYVADVPPIGARLFRAPPGVGESFIEGIPEIPDVCVHLATVGVFEWVLVHSVT